MEKKNVRVMAIGAHPDDVEFMCSGTLKLLKERGYEIHICVISNGDLGSSVMGPEEIMKVRRQEAMKAASLLEAEFYPLEERDFQIEFDDKTKKKVTEIIRKVDPIIVFTHQHEDYVVDHEVTSRLVRLGCFAASIPNYFTGSDQKQKIILDVPHLYYWSPLEGRNIYGDFVEKRIHIDITKTIDFKVEMLSCHKSQSEWMAELGMEKYISGMKKTAKKYGEVSGFNYAEGFTQHVATGYPEENILKDILGDVMKE